MIPVEMMRKIRRIQINTSHIVDELLAGGWHSAFKGSGIEFEEVRPYQPGDDVRSIDWNVTARSGDPYIKLFREERELAVMLLVDVSASQDLGTHHQSKRELLTELSATLAFSAIKNNDKVGLTMFTDRIEKSIPPRKGTRHVLRLIRDLLYHRISGTRTRLSAALDHLNRTASRRSVVFIVSDFQDSNYQRSLKIARQRHDIVPMVVDDRRELSIPNVGLIRLRDPESGQIVDLDTSSRRHRTAYETHMRSQAESRDHLFRRLRMAPIHFRTGEDFVAPLQKYFHDREARR